MLITSLHTYIHTYILHTDTHPDVGQLPCLWACVCWPQDLPAEKVPIVTALRPSHPSHQHTLWHLMDHKNNTRDEFDMDNIPEATAKTIFLFLYFWFDCLGWSWTNIWQIYFPNSLLLLVGQMLYNPYIPITNCPLAPWSLSLLILEFSIHVHCKIVHH